MPAATPDPSLAPFHEIVQRWFTERVGTPTDVQRRAWPEIAAGRHVLVTAPTGTGKTLTAFLWALDRLLTGATPGGAVRVLYVSPLKALNADVHRNLEVPLAELVDRFAAAGVDHQPVRAAVRSGDTPQNERQRMIRRPPEILITTPESLNLLLTSQGGRSILGGLETVILDEIHAVAGSKRGTHLMTAVERLTLLSGEFQRVALSATVRPLSTVADFVGGFIPEEGAGGEWRYRPRPVATVRSEAEKELDLEVRFPGGGEVDRPSPDPAANPLEQEQETSVWDLVVPQIVRTIRGHRSTLVFANSRRLTEKLTRMVNADQETDLAYSHHGSLSREVRQVVEERLKRGELPAIVATSSLELGIDVGALDRVVLVESPRSIASAIQRVGRAGHRVGEVSRGTLFPIYGRDFLDAAVLVRAVLDREIEEVRPVRSPLDVLAQVILSMVVAEPWDVEELYAFLRASWPYRDLSRRHYELVLEMLAGRYADSRVRELSPRISLDRVEGTVRARPGAARLIYLSGGTIPDRGYFHLRVEGEGEGAGAKIGELDEEFVWERSVGDTFTLGTQIWRVQRITHNDVVVTRASGSAAMAPFWRADERDRDFFFSEKVGAFLEEVEPAVDGDGIVERLRTRHRMDAGAAAELVRFLRAQKAALGGRLPHRRRLVVEHVAGQEGEPGQRPEAAGRRRIVLHTFWGGRVNRPFAVALAVAWEERFGAPLEILHDDDCVMVTVPAELEGEDLFSLVPPERIEELLRERLEATGFFGALFRQNAARALLLPRAGFRHRMPLWVTRERSKRLLQAVGRYGDFPLVLETWRTCLEDRLDLENLKRLLGEVASADLEVVHAATEAPSPFAANLVWKQTNTLMYADDAPEGGRGAALRRDLLRELVFASHLRPRIPAAVAEELRTKLQRVAPGYAPRDEHELLDWLKERLLIPADEWAELAAAFDRDRGERSGEGAGEAPPRFDELAAAVADRAVWVRLGRPGEDGGGDRPRAAVSVEALPRVAAAFGLDPAHRGAVAALDPRSTADPDAPAPAAALRNLERMVERFTATDEAPETADADAEPLARRADLLGEWLRFHGPVTRGRLEELFGRPLDPLLEILVEEERVVVDELTVGAGVTGPEVCDTANLETLLRWTRAAARPEFRALPVERLPLFLAAHQGLAPRGRDLEDLQNRLEALFGCSLPARSWEAEVLPSRLDPYRRSWLDALMRESDLAWTGTGEGRITFLFPADLELVADEEAEEQEAGDEGEDAEERTGALLGRLFPDLRGRFALGDLAEHADLPLPEVQERLWRLAWRGRVTTDTFEPVRRGVLSRFRVEAGGSGRVRVSSAVPVGVSAEAEAGEGGPSPTRRSRSRRPGPSRRRTDRWRPRRAAPGRWQALPEPEVADLDPLERDELAKERARLLLDRYGIVFRELLDRELPPLRWSRVFRALRLMELSGEVLAGQFFQGVPGLQFAAPGAFRTLRDELLPDDAVYWMNARDPASLAGVDLPQLKAALPERREGNWLVFHGERLVLEARRRGKTLTIRAAPDHPRIDQYLEPFKVMLGRDFAPRKAVTVEEINGEPAPESPYLPVLRRLFSATVEPRSVKLRKRYR